MSDAANEGIPGAYIRDVLELAARWGVTAEAVLRGLPLSAEALGVPSTRVPIPVCAEIVARAERLTGEPALAVHAGTQMRVSSHGFLGFAAMTSQTVRAAIELAVRFAETRTNVLGLSLCVEGDTASLVIEERAPLGRFREFAIISLMMGLWRLGESLTGRPLDGVAECAFPAPPYARDVPLAGRVRFSQPTHRLVFRASVLGVPLTSADPIATQLARAECERELAAVVDAGLMGRVRAAVLAHAPSVPPLDEVARELRVSSRTLKRRLADRGTTFSGIVDEVRRQRAFLLLQNRELSVGEVAARLGYRELPSFTRAFRRWTGVSPAAYRQRQATVRPAG
jgi:AraC-like DNA-binding protein